MAQGADMFSDDQVEQVLRAIGDAITLKRRFAAAWVTAHGDAWPLGPIKPSRIELAVLTTLAQTYGPALLDDPDLMSVIDGIAECGAVVMVQRILWSGRPDDVSSSVRLSDAHVPFEILCSTWPEVFMAQAQSELQEFRLRPTGTASSCE